MMISVAILMYLFVAAIYDLRYRIIPNELVLLGIVAGASYSIIFISFSSLWIYSFHLLITVILLFPLFYFRVVGAGDVKLFAVVSPFLQTDTFIILFITAILTGGIFSLIQTFRYKDYFIRFFCLNSYLHSCLLDHKIKRYESKSEKNRQLPFAVCIFIGFVFIFLKGALNWRIPKF
ncbi:MAG: A24 family peptidase [Lachnospiraceae bacterium]|nr:A24 family peptidase [Lachnospiraceae bacterium]